MIEIECPHCNGDIELDDDDFGLFRCPCCDEEFLWEQESEGIGIRRNEDWSKSDLHRFALPGILICFLLGIVLVIFWVVNSYANAMSCGWQNTC